MASNNNNNTTAMPVTVLTGFLGSGKTTLLNYILKEKHGKRIAVIENEFGQVGIDDGLIINAEEEVFEMNNGCICCKVRGDLIRILGKLAQKKNKFDYVIIETTGLADPAPVAQTFFVDEEIKSDFRLDGIITLVDAKHLIQHLDEKKGEGVENEAVEQLAFADRVILNKKDLVTPEELKEVERRIRQINKFAPIQVTQQSQVDLDFVLNIKAFDLTKVLEAEPDFLKDTEHSHDSTVTSTGFEVEGTLDGQKLDAWLKVLLREKGADIFRMKGILNIKGSSKRFVFQGVHMLFDGKPDREWKENESKVNKLIFIGKNLNSQELEKGFKDCMA